MATSGKQYQGVLLRQENVDYMREFVYVDFEMGPTIVTEEHIRKDYYPYWRTTSNHRDAEDEVLFEQCLADWQMLYCAVPQLKGK